MFDNLRNLRGRNLQPVLNRVTSAIEGALQAETIVGVAGYLLPPTVRLVDDGLQLFDGRCGLRHEVTVLVEPRTMGHVDLDPVSPIVELLPRRLARFHGS